MAKNRFDNLPPAMTAHAIRGLRRCTICNGMGHKDYMIAAGYSGEGDMHTLCFAEERGAARIIGLPMKERNKLRLSDLMALTERDKKKVFEAFSLCKQSECAE